MRKKSLSFLILLVIGASLLAAGIYSGPAATVTTNGLNTPKVRNQP